MSQTCFPRLFPTLERPLCEQRAHHLPKRPLGQRWPQTRELEQRLKGRWLRVRGVTAQAQVETGGSPSPRPSVTLGKGFTTSCLQKCEESLPPSTRHFTDMPVRTAEVMSLYRSISEDLALTWGCRLWGVTLQ